MRRVEDASLQVSKALSNGAGTVESDGIDLELTGKSDFVAGVDVRVEAPALTTTLLPDTETMTYEIYHDDDPEFGTEELLATVGVQTGADSAGAAAAEYRMALPSHVKRYIRLKAVKTGTGDASTVSATLALIF